MTLDEAGRLQEAWETHHGDKLCHHVRVIDSLTTQDGETSGKLVCRECGAILPAPLKAPPDSSPPN
jgi:hypothetical protein